MASLTLVNQHLFWQQRLNKEVRTKSNFFRQKLIRVYPSKPFSPRILNNRKYNLQPIMPQSTNKNHLLAYSGPFHYSIPHTENRGRFTGKTVPPHNILFKPSTAGSLMASRMKKHKDQLEKLATEPVQKPGTPQKLRPLSRERRGQIRFKEGVEEVQEVLTERLKREEEIENSESEEECLDLQYVSAQQYIQELEELLNYERMVMNIQRRVELEEVLKTRGS